MRRDGTRDGTVKSRMGRFFPLSLIASRLARAERKRAYEPNDLAAPIGVVVATLIGLGLWLYLVALLSLFWSFL